MMVRSSARGDAPEVIEDIAAAAADDNDRGENTVVWIDDDGDSCESDDVEEEEEEETPDDNEMCDDTRSWCFSTPSKQRNLQSCSSLCKALRFNPISLFKGNSRTVMCWLKKA